MLLRQLQAERAEKNAALAELEALRKRFAAVEQRVQMLDEPMRDAEGEVGRKTPKTALELKQQQQLEIGRAHV